MTRLEIALNIFTSGKAENVQGSFSLADLFLGEVNTPIKKDNASQPLKSRSAERIELLLSKDFEANEDLTFSNGEVSISPKLIDEYSEEEWGRFIKSLTQEIKPTLQDIKQVELPNFDLTVTNTDIFNNKDYIEFEMPKTKLRLYRIENQIEAEKYLESKGIVASSENKEHQLGITIFKK